MSAPVALGEGLGEALQVVLETLPFGNGLRQKGAIALVGTTLAGDVAGNQGRAGHLAALVPDRRDRERDDEALAVGAQALGLVVLGSAACQDAAEDLPLLRQGAAAER